MTDETTALIRKALFSLRKAEIVRREGLADEAGRLAYAAGHQAALAWIFQQTGRAVKTHKGAHAEFTRLLKTDPRFDERHRRFLGRTYRYKQSADYETGEDAIVTDAEADEAIAEATHLVQTIEAVLQETSKETP